MTKEQLIEKMTKYYHLAFSLKCFHSYKGVMSAFSKGEAIEDILVEEYDFDIDNEEYKEIAELKETLYEIMDNCEVDYDHKKQDELLVCFAEALLEHYPHTNSIQNTINKELNAFLFMQAEEEEKLAKENE